jgi:hypothetical protein
MCFYRVLDVFFFLFHALFTGFCTLGWIWRKTRKANLVLLLITGISWLFIGPLCGYGLGYCPFTDWHWQVKIKLGYTSIPRSYIKFFLDTLTGLDFDALCVDIVVALVFASALIISLMLNIRDFVKRRKHQ